jgi:hypothetical protein
MFIAADNSEVGVLHSLSGAMAIMNHIISCIRLMMIEKTKYKGGS